MIPLNGQICKNQLMGAPVRYNRRLLPCPCHLQPPAFLSINLHLYKNYPNNNKMAFLLKTTLLPPSPCSRCPLQWWRSPPPSASPRRGGRATPGCRLGRCRCRWPAGLESLPEAFAAGKRQLKQEWTWSALGWENADKKLWTDQLYVAAISCPVKSSLLKPKNWHNHCVFKQIDYSRQKDFQFILKKKRKN